SLGRVTDRPADRETETKKAVPNFFGTAFGIGNVPGYGTLAKAGSLHAPVLLLPLAAARTQTRVNVGKPLNSPVEVFDGSRSLQTRGIASGLVCNRKIALVCGS